jgi:hypothetical protein
MPGEVEDGYGVLPLGRAEEPGRVGNLGVPGDPMAQKCTGQRIDDEVDGHNYTRTLNSNLKF